MLVPFVRTMILYIVIISVIRLMGKRQVGELQPSELVITILISAVASVPVQDIDIPLSHGIIPILTLMSAEVIISSFSQNHIRFRRLLTGNPVLVIRDGNFVQKSVNKLRLSVDDILAGLRLGGVFDVREVKIAQIETNGQMSILLNDDKLPANNGDLNIKPSPTGPFYTIISDGHVISDNLKSISQSTKWMEQIIKAKGADRPEEVFFLSADKYGNTVFSKKEDKNAL